MTPKKSRTAKDRGSNIPLANKPKPNAPAEWYIPCIITKLQVPLSDFGSLYFYYDISFV